VFWIAAPRGKKVKNCKRLQNEKMILVQIRSGNSK